MDYKELPAIVFSQEQQEAYTGHQTYTNQEGIVNWGKYEGQALSEIADTEYLRVVVVRCIANAIVVQNRISGATPETLRGLITKYPEFEGKFRSYFASQHSITIPENEPTDDE
jgi:hypothetical protein